jgi:hypothetical protein
MHILVPVWIIAGHGIYYYIDRMQEQTGVQFKTHHTMDRANEVIELDKQGYLPYAISRKVGLDVRTVKKILEAVNSFDL